MRGPRVRAMSARRRTAMAASAVAVVAGSTLAVAPSAHAATWHDVVTQQNMIYGWCQQQHYSSGGGNWSDGYWCWRPGSGQVRQSTAPGDMCRSIQGDATIRFHIILPTSSKNGACGYFY